MAAASDKTATEMLATPIQFLKGVGPDRGKLFQRLDLCTARDLLYFFPRDYQDASELRTIEQLEEDCLLSVLGTVEEIDLRNTGPGRSILGILVREGSQYLRAVWFNQPYMRDRFRQGQRVLLSGKARLNSGRWEMPHPRAEVFEQDQQPSGGRILPVYRLTDGLNQSHVRRVVQGVLDTCMDGVDEVFPDEFLKQNDLWSIQEALPQIHFPDDRDRLDRAARRLIYQELLVLQLGLALRRQLLTTGRRAPSLPRTAKIDARIQRLLPFELTAGQQQAVAEVAGDMAQECPMNRLLHGDVGSGKTIVAVYAMLLAVAHGRQAVLMAPTEVLAQQHELTIRELLIHSQVRIGLLTGSLGSAERKALLGQIAANEIDLVIGTHAILQSDVDFSSLGLVVIDEQHKFGVRQRATLRGAGLDPHYLVMTATPIPRTVSMTLFGDLDVSTLVDSPPGRQQVHTYLASEPQREKWWEFFRNKLTEGRQGYVITPRVDESDSDRIHSVEQAFEELANGPLEAFRLDLIHGRMSSSQKQAAMDSFREGRTQVLVATSVVEVGVDIANATVMTIESGQRFGLAQLHQLRGRISRGQFSGYLCVFSDPASEQAQQRLDAFAGTHDGFELAEIDFRLRGPGDLFGTRQHGLPPLRVADLVRDAEILEIARRDARDLVADDPQLGDPAWSLLRRMVLVRYQEAFDLSDVG